MKKLADFITESYNVVTLVKTKGGAPLLQCSRAYIEDVEDVFQIIIPGDKESTNYVYKNKFNLKDGCVYTFYEFEYESEEASEPEDMVGVSHYVVYIFEDQMTCIGKKFPEEYLK